MRKADNLPPSCAVVTKSGNLNFLEPSGPIQASNGTALPLPLLKYKISWKSAQREAVFPCGQTDGQTDMTMPIVAFRSFVKAPKKVKSNRPFHICCFASFVHCSNV